MRDRSVSQAGKASRRCLRGKKMSRSTTSKESPVSCATRSFEIDTPKACCFPSKEMAQSFVRSQDSLWNAGGARSEEDVGWVFGLARWLVPSGAVRPHASTRSPSNEILVTGSDTKSLARPPHWVPSGVADSKASASRRRSWSIRFRRARGSDESRVRRTPRASNTPSIAEIKPKERCPLTATTSPG